MPRVTNKEVHSAFTHWLNVIGGKEATSYRDVGAYQLDHDSICGGWKIERIVNEHGGTSEVNYGRIPSKQFISHLHFGCITISENKRGDKCSV